MFSFAVNILTIIIVFANFSYKTLLFIYRLSVLIIAIIDRIVEAIIMRAVYRLSDPQRKVIMHTLLLIGVGLVRELSS